MCCGRAIRVTSNNHFMEMAAGLLFTIYRAILQANAFRLLSVTLERRSFKVVQLQLTRLC